MGDPNGRVELVYDRGDGQDIVFRNAWIPNFRARRIGDGWVLTNRAGRWALVDDREFHALETVAIPFPLYSRLQSLGLLLTESSASAYFEQYRQWTTPHFRHPTHHIIIATLRCNLSCTYCHAAVVPANAGAEYDLDESTADAILEFASNSVGTEMSFEFQGGEALLNKAALIHIIPRIREFEAATGRRIYISLQTNATILTDALVAFLREHNVRLGTSVDGVEAVHDRNRKYATGQGSYAHVTANVRRYNLPVLPTITASAATSWREMVDAELRRGVHVVHFQNVYPINNAKANWKDVGIDGPTFLRTYGDVVDYLKAQWTSAYFPIERRMRLGLSKLMRGRDTDFADFGNPCGMVHSQIAYMTNGDVYTCDEGRDFPEFRLGNVKTDAYDDIVFGKRMRELKSLSLPNDPECQRCAYQQFCSTCPVYERAVDGTLHSRHAGTDHCKHTLWIYDKLFTWIQRDPTTIKSAATSHGICG